MGAITKEYKGHVIEAKSIASTGTQFTVDFCIEKHGDDHVDVTWFESGQVFPNEATALEAGVLMGQRKIDDGYDPGVPVVDK